MAARPRVLIADDKQTLLKLLERVLSDTCEVLTASDGKRALALLGTRTFDVVLTDIRMPGADGFEVLRAVKERGAGTEVILMTAYGSVPKAVEAMKAGAYDYLTKPFEPDEVTLLVARAAERKSLREEAASLKGEVAQLSGRAGLLGKSAPMRELFALIDRAAEVDITVLVTGETGTGKELVARAVHQASARASRRFVPVNCGALPAGLVESELFGHARGAFTGAVQARAGLFEEAAGGTLFLDEVGELPLPVQVKLNRALQHKEIRRVGVGQTQRVDVRVIAATHRDLKAEAAAGRFREDLFYRLNVFPLHLPPLRERKEDVLLLAVHFLERFAAFHKRPAKSFSPEALRQLTCHAWPGNVRELENAVERAVAISRGEVVEADALGPAVAQASAGEPSSELLASLTYREALERSRSRLSREYLVALMHQFEGNVTRAAERAGIERESLHRLLRRHGVQSDDYKR